MYFIVQYTGLNRKTSHTFGDHLGYSFYERRRGVGQRDPRGRSHRSVHVNLNNKHILNIVNAHALFILLALALVRLQNFWSTHHFSHIINCKTEGIEFIYGPENSHHTSWISLQGCNLTVQPAFCKFCLFWTEHTETWQHAWRILWSARRHQLAALHLRLSPISQIES